MNMKKSLHTLAASAAAMLLTLGSMNASAADPLKIYGNVVDGKGDWTTWEVGIWSMTQETPGAQWSFEQVIQNNVIYGLRGAVMADGYYYTFFDTEANTSDYDNDLDSQERVTVMRKWKWDAAAVTMTKEEEVRLNASKGFNFTDLTYDYADGCIYGIYIEVTSDGNYYRLGRVNVNEGVANMTVTPIGSSAIGEIRALAAHPNGKLYGIFPTNTYTYLYEINKKTGEMKELGKLGQGGAGTGCKMSAVVDWRTGKLYFTSPDIDSSHSSSEISKLATSLYCLPDVNSLSVEKEFDFKYKESVTGLWFEDDYVKKAQDMALTEANIPTQMKLGETSTVKVTVKNVGEEAATSYKVNLYVNGELAGSANGSDLAPAAMATLEISYTPINEDGKKCEMYAEVVVSGDGNADNNKSDAVTVSIAQPLLPGVTIQGEAGTRMITLSWEAPGEDTPYTETFEEYTAFAINNFGAWKTIMNSETRATPGLGDVYSGALKYPNAGYPFAFQVFNPEQSGLWLDTWMDDYTSQYPTWATHSGEQMLISLVGAKPASYDGGDPVWVDADNWLISPELNGKAQTIQFYAKHWRSNIPTYYSEGVNSGEYNQAASYFNVLYSTSGTEMSDFILLAEKVSSNQDFQEAFQFDLPAGAKYFAIQNVTPYDSEVTGLQALYLDDITFIPKTQGTFDHYNIYCDGEKVGETKDTSYSTQKPRSGSATYVVTAVYQEGESPNSNAYVYGDATAIQEVSTAAAVAPRQQGTFDLSGRRVAGTQTLRKGIYVVNGKKIVK